MQEDTFRQPSIARRNVSPWHSWLLSAALLSALFLPSEIYSVLFILVVGKYGTKYGWRLDPWAKSILRPALVMTSCGLLFFWKNEPHDVLRDIWAASKIFSCFFIGYYVSLKVKNLNSFFNFYIKIYLLLAIVFIATIFIEGKELGVSANTETHVFSLGAALAIPLLLFRSTWFQFSGSPQSRTVIAIVICTAFALSFSRTATGCVSLLILAMFGTFDNVKRLIIGSLLLIALIAMAIQFMPTLESGDITFLGKIQNSFVELAFVDDSDPAAMLLNWRGFEAFRAFAMFIEASPLEQLFGRGLGATVDLGITVQMSEEMSYQFLPIIHSGYFHVLTKYGMLGVAAYLLMIWRISFPQTVKLFKARLPAHPLRLAIGIGFIIAYTSIVITGVFNKGALDPYLIFLGALVGGVAQQCRQHHCAQS